MWLETLFVQQSLYALTVGIYVCINTHKHFALMERQIALDF